MPSSPPAKASQALPSSHHHLGHGHGRRRARSSVAAAPAAAVDHLGGFFVRSVTPRESSMLAYTSLASPGTYTEYVIAVSDIRGGPAARWLVARRFSAFLLLRDELQRAAGRRHCPQCAQLSDELQLLARQLPRKRLFGSSSSAVVRRRAALLAAYVRGLLALAADARCPRVCFGFAVQVRSFLTRDAEPDKSSLVDELPGLGKHGDWTRDQLGARRATPLSALAIRESDEDDSEDEPEPSDFSSGASPVESLDKPVAMRSGGRRSAELVTPPR